MQTRLLPTNKNGLNGANELLSELLMQLMYYFTTCLIQITVQHHSEDLDY